MWHPLPDFGYIGYAGQVTLSWTPRNKLAGTYGRFGFPR